MKKENTMMIAVIAIVMMILVSGVVIIKSSSGVNPPFTVIESESMQHDDESELGIIDTGDMILVKSPEKTKIKSYIEGYNTDYESFGNYGSIIIYNRAFGNPVIHRAIIWLNSNGATWSAPSLENYPIELWSCSDNDHDYMDLSGTLNITLKSDYRTIDISIDLEHMNKVSGYITMGDNNNYTDQSTSISFNTPVNDNRIKSIAWKEIPWIGSIKMIFKGDMDIINEKVPNTIPCLCAFIVTFILIVISIGFIIDEIQLKKVKKKDIFDRKNSESY